MKLIWKFSSHEIEKIQHMIKKGLEDTGSFIAERHRKNVNPDTAPDKITKDMIWHAHFMCQITSNQDSSSNSPVLLFLEDTDPYPLSWKKTLANQENLFQFIQNTMTNHNLNRFREQIPHRTVENFNTLQNGEWANILSYANKLLQQRQKSPVSAHEKLEQEAARYVEDNYKGFGPKQSRNFWQYLGLTRYVFVLDSRVGNWTRKHLKISNQANSVNRAFWSTRSTGYYHFISEVLGEFCRKAQVLPCLFDAAVFWAGE